MSFPAHDSYWVEIATFLEAHIDESDDILAPDEFEYRFVHCFPYRVAESVPVDRFQWVVVNKAELERLAATFLLDAVEHFQPVYANAVFVVLCEHDRLPRLEDSDHLSNFDQRLMDIVRKKEGNGPPLASKDAVLDRPMAVKEAQPANASLKVSIITICYNAAETIEATFKAVAAQAYSNLEYIVVDGDSNDDTLSLCERYQSIISTLVSEPDDGIYNAMNKGIDLATGDFLYFANADDYLFGPSVVENVVAFIQDNPEADVVYGSHESRFPGAGFPSSIHTPASPDQMVEAVVCLNGGCLLQPATFFRHSVFDQVGGFSEEYDIASDYKWFLDALETNATFRRCPCTVVSYAHGGRSGDIRSLFQEVFDIQSKSALCQQPELAEKRTLALQEDFINMYSEAQRLQVLTERRDRHLARIKQRTPST